MSYTQYNKQWIKAQTNLPNNTKICIRFHGLVKSTHKELLFVLKTDINNHRTGVLYGNIIQVFLSTKMDGKILNTI
jgi:hypothetical protein